MRSEKENKQNSQEVKSNSNQNRQENKKANK